MRESTSGRRAAITWLAGVAACLLLGFSFYALQRWLEKGQLSDVHIYKHYAHLMRGGALPYRDFSFEYPPAALPALLLPAYMGWHYATSFAVLMGVCGAGCIAAAATALRKVGASGGRTTGALLLIGVSPLLLGSLFDTRFDLWPTLLAVAAVAALVSERPLLTGGLLGLGFAAKLWPGVLLPIALAYLWRRRGRRSALVAALGFAAVTAACFLPFAVLAPGGLRESIAGQLNRPLQVESLGAALLMVARHLGKAHTLTTYFSHGAQALKGTGTQLAAVGSTVLEVLAVLAVWVSFARRRDANGETVLLACAAAVAAVVAFDKVLSPQYLIWLVPLVLLVRGTRGAAGIGLLLAALGLTQQWFPDGYRRLVYTYGSPWSWYLLGRDLALVALAVVLLAELALKPGRSRTGSGAATRRISDLPRTS